MTRYDYRHGPHAGTRIMTTHRGSTEAIPRANLAGPIGWCCLCTRKDVPAVTTGWWTDKTTGMQVEIAVCGKHRRKVKR